MFDLNGNLLTTFTDPEPEPVHYFGWSVTGVGSDRVLIGAPSGATTNLIGSAYLFDLDGNLLQTIDNPDPQAGDRFGHSVAAVGEDRLLIGANWHPNYASFGEAYLFDLSGSLIATFANPDPQSPDSFAESVAAVGDSQVLVGCPNNDTGAGTAYLFSVESYLPGLLADGARSGSVSTSMLSYGAITTAKLRDGAVTPAKISPTYFAGDPDSAGLDLTGTPTQATYAVTFERPFATGTMPDIALPDGWTLDGAATEAGFTAVRAFSPQIVDATDNAGPYCSMALIHGKPAISYQNTVGDDTILFSIATDATGTTWTAPVTAVSTPGSSIGRYQSLALVDGRPAIAYWDNTNHDLDYVIAADANGTTWNAPQSIQSSNSVGQAADLAVVNGHPAISYRHETDDHLMYRRATDAAGTNWGPIITVDSLGDVGYYTSLAIVNGYPAISYYDVGNGDLKFIRADDANGDSWTESTAETLDADGDVGLHTSMALINGRPAIAYWDATHQQIKYTIASDANGTAWTSPIAIGSTGPVDSGYSDFLSLAAVDGRPAVSFYNETTQDLQLVVAHDATGKSWPAPIAVDTAGNVGKFNSLVAVEGLPGIAYHDGTDADLKFARVPLAPSWTAASGDVAPIRAQSVASISNPGTENVFVATSAGNASLTGQSNTAVGANSLASITGGSSNTALGSGSLENNLGGSSNTAIGDQALNANVSGDFNTAVGTSAMISNISGNDNTAFGVDALRSNTTGSQNTAIGQEALKENTTASSNTAVGTDALKENTTGSKNTAVGQDALQANTTGVDNTAVGEDSMLTNTEGDRNTALGRSALRRNTNGFDNTAVGHSALNYNTEGYHNVAIGIAALSANTIGYSNTAIGRRALQNSLEAINNVAVGEAALNNTTTGSGNTAVGDNAAHDNTEGLRNTALGKNALFSNTTGNDNIAIGNEAGTHLTTGDNNIIIGNTGLAGDSGTMRIGTLGTHTSTFLQGVHGVTPTGTTQLVTVDENGELGSTADSIYGAGLEVLRLGPGSFSSESGGNAIFQNHSGVWRDSGSDGIIAPLNLPNGATILSVGVYYYSDAATTSPSLKLLQKSDNAAVASETAISLLLPYFGSNPTRHNFQQDTSDVTLESDSYYFRITAGSVASNSLGVQSWSSYGSDFRIQAIHVIWTR